MNKLYEALAKAQVNFKVPQKDKKAHYGTYASIGSINAATNVALSEQGLSVWQPIVTEETTCYIKTILVHSSGESIESIMPLPILEKGGNYFHKLGAAISYIRRYALMSILNISADDVEDDGDSLNNVKIEKTECVKVNPQQLQAMKEIYELLSNENQRKAKEFLKREYQIEMSRNLPNKNYSEYTEFLNKLLDYQKDKFMESLPNV